MSAAPDSSWRLQRLAQILAESKPLPSTSARETDPADVHLGSVSLERISRLTAELSQKTASDIDDIDRLAMRLLLNDYTAAVAHLRAAMRLAEQRMADATLPIEQAGLHVKQREKRGTRAPRER
jgi:paraquat-inducible protein B